MSLSSQATQQAFPFDYDKVFDGLLKVLPLVGMRVRNNDRLIGRIEASTGMSLFSWGEMLALSVSKIDEERTNVSIDSSLKLGINLAGAHRHQKNFNKIIMALSKDLQSRFPQRA